MFSLHCLLISCHESFSLLTFFSFDRQLFLFDTFFVVHLIGFYNSLLTESRKYEIAMIHFLPQTLMIETLLESENQKFQKNRLIRTVFFDHLSQYILKF